MYCDQINVSLKIAALKVYDLGDVVFPNVSANETIDGSHGVATKKGGHEMR